MFTIGTRVRVKATSISKRAGFAGKVIGRQSTPLLRMIRVAFHNGVEWFDADDLIITKD